MKRKTLAELQTEEPRPNTLEFFEWQQACERAMEFEDAEREARAAVKH